MKRHSLGVIPFRPFRLPRLRLPLASTSELNAAQISVLPEFESVQPFRRERWAELEAFQPRVLVGYGFDLQKLADKVKTEEMQLRSVDRAIAALTDCGSSPISDALRDHLWRTFGVPVYELIVAPGCRLLACECEAHDGWHVQEGAQAYLVKGELVYDAPPLRCAYTGFTGNIETQLCECGRKTARLKNLAPFLPQPYERRLAAIA
ncbi:MAG: hypothetical protein JO210_18230 [Acidobacteriaceae bacterium]|nr:hypothetical protein [Acidobacteriaceae bacterium]